MKKLLICLFLTAFCFANAYADEGDVPYPPPSRPGPGHDLPSMTPFSSLKNTAPQITYTKGYIGVYTASYKNIIIRVQAIDGVVLYENTMTQSTLIIDARNWDTNTYDVIVLTK